MNQPGLQCPGHLFIGIGEGVLEGQAATCLEPITLQGHATSLQLQTKAMCCDLVAIRTACALSPQSVPMRAAPEGGESGALVSTHIF